MKRAERDMIGEYVKIACTILALIAYFLGVVAVKDKMFGWLFILLIIVGSLAAVVFVIFVFIAIVKSKTRLRQFINYHTLPKKPSFLLKKDITYHFTSRTNMTFTKLFHIKSKQGGVNSFTDRYMWTKNREEKCELSALFNDTIVILPDDAHWHTYTINFKPLCKNDIHQTGMQIKNLHDPEKKSQLFLSTGIFEPTKELKLMVQFNNPLKIKNNSAEIEIYHTYHAQYPNDRRKVDIKEKNNGYFIEYHEKYPLNGACYKLVWQFEEE